MLKVQNLHAEVDGNNILNGINLRIQPGEVHAIMGPNGSGKSTISKVIAGHPSYEVTEGKIDYQYSFDPVDLLVMDAYERARQGIFLGFQYPIEIPGISNIEFLRSSYNELCKFHGTTEMNESEFRKFLAPKLELLKMNPQFLDRPVNEGFSGGEKKRNEILQLLILNPRLAILDEIDSGLDIDALKEISAAVNSYKNANNAVLLITHYQRLLNYIQPDVVHIFANGRIVKSGGPELALKLEEEGYDWVEKEALQ